MIESELDNVVASDPVVLWEDQPAWRTELHSFRELEAFVDQERQFFNALPVPIGDFTDVSRCLTAARATGNQTDAANQIRVAVSSLKNRDKLPFPSKSGEAITLKSLTPQQQRGAKLVRENNNGFLNEFETFQGAIAWALIAAPGIRGTLDGLAEAWAESVAEIRSHENRSRQDIAASRQEVSQWMGQAQQEIKTYTAQVNNDIADCKRNFESLQLTAETQIRELLQLYREQLRLEGPVTYWEELATASTRQRRDWFWIGGMIIGAIGFFGYHIAKGPFLADSISIVSGFRQVTLTVTTLSLLVYGVATAFRFASSSAHLAADAEERRVMTMVYLALIKEGGDAITSEERKVVLAAIFARSETGLIKGDSGPTMPSIVDYIQSKRM